MPAYEYKGLNQQGKQVKGVKEADNPRMLKTLLRKEGVFLTDLYETKAGAADKKKLVGNTNKSEGLLSKEIDFAKYFQRVSLQEVALFTRQLATLTNAGIPLVECLTALADQTENEKFKRVLSQIKERVNEGTPLAEALREHPSVFDHLYVNMIRAGESAGALEQVLYRLAEFNEKQMQLRRQVSGAMVYPAVMSGVGVLIVIILMTFVVPKITKLFEDINATLPVYTKMLIAVSNALSSYWFIVFPGLIGGIVMFRRYLNTEKGTQAYDRFVLRVPIFGGLVRMVATSRFASTMATLLSSGVPMLSAMEIVKTIVGNSVLSKVIEDARDNVREGESLAVPLKRSGEFDPLVGHMITIGERSGHLEEMLGHVAVSYEQQVETRVQQLTSLLEPLILVAMAVVVGFIIMSIMMPIMQLNQAIRG
ncbi:MAG: type II secretion system inner membrane protein GspF [Myxococcales bacterium]|nr:type II secretion system inner membrane protein GspF [Myxococcales bacterium]